MTTARDNRTKVIPKWKKRHYSYNESVDESQGLIEDEPVEVQGEQPAKENESVETVTDENAEEETPAFKE